MKTNTKTSQGLVPFLSCFFLTFVLTAGGIFCLVTAFDLPVDTVSLPLILAAWCGAATLVFYLKRSWVWSVALWAIGLTVCWIWFRGEIEQGIRLAYTRLSEIYTNAYPALQINPWPPEEGANCTACFALWGGLTAWVCAWTINRRQCLAAALLFSLLPLMLCLVVIDTPPDTGWLMILLVAVCLLLLTQGCRHRSGIGGGKLTLLLLLPVALLFAGLNSLMPYRSNYVRSETGQRALQAMVDFTSQFVSIDASLLGELSIYVPVAQSESLVVGPRRDSNRVVMEVRSSISGPVYLRGMSYGEYTGTAWEQIDPSAYPNPLNFPSTLWDTGGGSLESVYIRTRSVLPVLYIPYYTSEENGLGQSLLDLGTENVDALEEYRFYYTTQPPEFDQAVNISEDTAQGYYERFVHTYYTQLPEATRQSAYGIAETWGITELENPNVYQIASYVEQNVRDSAKYDIETERMPAGNDFALWFLQESDTGYCVHFASAAVVMLRAMDIPARYVTGYLVNGSAGNWIEVTAHNAHAWVEYYVDGIGWLRLEPTPGSGVVQTAAGNGQETQPQETRPPTEPTERPTEATETAAPDTEPTVRPTAPPSTQPASGPDDEQETWFQFQVPAWLWWCLGALAVFFLHRPAVLAVRRRTMGKDNREFLRRWKNACRLAKWLKQPEQCRELALKARFSQHAMDTADWAELTRWQDELSQKLKTASWPRRFLITWILVLV